MMVAFAAFIGEFAAARDQKIIRNLKILKEQQKQEAVKIEQLEDNIKEMNEMLEIFGRTSEIDEANVEQKSTIEITQVFQDIAENF